MLFRSFVGIHHLVGGREPDARGGVEASSFFEWGGANADGTPGFATQRPGWPKPIHDLLVQYGVTAVLHGHDHLYVRQVRDGVTYLEVPQPGFAREGSTRSAVDYGYTTGTLLGSPAFVRLTVSPAGADLVLRRTPAPGMSADSVRLAPRRVP